MRKLYIPVNPGFNSVPLAQSMFMQNEPLEEWEHDKAADWEAMGYEVLEIITSERKWDTE